jgi:hypothetical protein
MGICVADFPNLFIVTGPQAPFANLPTSIEQNAIWISKCIGRMEADGYDVFEERRGLGGVERPDPVGTR